jgi:hypothetical protein
VLPHDALTKAIQSHPVSQQCAIEVKLRITRLNLVIKQYNEWLVSPKGLKVKISSCPLNKHHPSKCIISSGDSLLCPNRLTFERIALERNALMQKAHLDSAKAFDSICRWQLGLKIYNSCSEWQEKIWSLFYLLSHAKLSHANDRNYQLYGYRKQGYHHLHIRHLLLFSSVIEPSGILETCCENTPLMIGRSTVINLLWNQCYCYIIVQL